MSQYDPDKLYLTKKQILGIGDKLIARWNKNKQANLKMILLTKGAQLLVRAYSPEQIEQYYKEFFREAFAVMEDNARAGDPALKILRQVHDAPKEPQPVSELDFSLKKLAQIADFGGMTDD